MRKFKAFISTVVLLSVSATSSLAQQVNFTTYEFNDLSQHVIFQTDGITRAVGPNIVAQIAIGPTGGTLAPVGSPVALQLSQAFFEGFVVGGAVVVTQPFGSTVDYQIKAWDITTGDTYDQATLRGISEVAMVTLATGVSDQNIPDLNTFASFNLEAVPEPSTVALGVIGGLALLMRRRK